MEKSNPQAKGGANVCLLCRMGALTPYHCVDVTGISHGTAAADPS